MFGCEFECARGENEATRVCFLLLTSNRFHLLFLVNATDLACIYYHTDLFLTGFFSSFQLKELRKQHAAQSLAVHEHSSRDPTAPVRILSLALDCDRRELTLFLDGCLIEVCVQVFVL